MDGDCPNFESTFRSEILGSSLRSSAIELGAFVYPCICCACGSSRQRRSHMVRGQTSFMKELEKKKKTERARAETAKAEADAKLRNQAAISIQSAARRQLARNELYELTRPRTSSEVLAVRQVVFLQDRRASRLAGFGVHMLPQSSVESYLVRMKEERKQAEQKAAEDAPLSRIQVAQRLRALSQRQRAAAARARARHSHGISSQREDNPPHEDATPKEASEAGGRQRRVSKELMAMARRAARRSHDAMKRMAEANKSLSIALSDI